MNKTEKRNAAVNSGKQLADDVNVQQIGATKYDENRDKFS
jgi:hypothetical protein